VAQLGVTFGFDSGTKDLIQGLPDNIRQQIEKAVADILPMIDKSVLNYETKLNDIVHNNIDFGMKSFQCAVDGSVQNVKDTISSSLASVFFRDAPNVLTPGNIPGEFKSLNDAIDTTRSRITASTKANDIAIAYADLMHYASLIRCSTQIGGLPESVELQSQISRLYSPALEWAMIVGDPDRPFCTNADDCVQKRKAQIQQIIKAADHRDVELAQAEQAFAKVASPPELSFMQRLVSGQIDVITYEYILGSYRQIERSIAGEQAWRIKRAQDAWATANTARQQSKSLAGTEVFEVDSPTSIVDFQNAVQRYPTLIGYIKAALDSASTADNLDPEFDGQYAQFKTEMQTYSNNAECMRARAAAVLAHPIRFKGSRPNSAPAKC
jgi:hypothetical protein